VDWIDLAWNRDKWQDFVKAGWTVGFHKMGGNSWLEEELLALQNNCAGWNYLLFVYRKYMDHDVCVSPSSTAKPLY